MAIDRGQDWVKLEPVGPDWGGPRFDDRGVAERHGSLSAVAVNSGQIINDVRGRYGREWTRHVDSTGSLTEVELDDDPLVGVSGTFGDYYGAAQLLTLTLHLRSGATEGPFGDPAPGKDRTRFESFAPEGHVVVAVHGNASKRSNGDHFITSLGLFVAPFVEPSLDELIQQQGPPQQQQQHVVQAQMEDLIGESKNWDAQAMAAGMPLAASAGYTSDAIDPKAADRLGIMAEVEPLCRVLIASAVKPPLSLGLFGDWGSGKSFFMAKMQGYIETLSDTARAEDAETYCHEVVQIRFNAWHFADANLWASLAAHIFKELFEEIERKAARRESSAKAKARAKTASEKVRERLAGTARKRAQDTLDASQRELASARDQRIEATRAYVKALRGGKSEVAQRLDGSLDKLEHKFGLPAASDSIEDAISAGRQLRSFGDRLATVMRMFGRQPYLTLLIPVVLIAIALPFVIDFVSRQFPELFTSTSEILTKIGAMVSGVAAWIAGLVQRGSTYLGELEAVANDLEQAKLAGDAKTEPALGELNEAEAREQAALEQVAVAERKVVSAEHYDPGRELAELITARQGESSYERQLGIISEIRKDFEQMSELLAAQDAGEGGESRVDRIVLYIDDLDRCKPRRVVEILEAIHLLLSFPLFVVVVAVDPRWLRRCLQKIYPELLGRVVADDEGELDPGTSTSQDYLEKIFQVPFALRPVEADGFRGMMVDLMGEPGPARPKALRPNSRAEPSHAVPPVKKAPSFVPPGKPAPVEATPIEAASADEGLAEILAPPQAPELEPEAPVAVAVAVAVNEAANTVEEQQRLVAIVSNARPLVFTKEEHDDILRLAPLFRAPRSVKRFVNIYRLVRVSVTPDDHEGFIGTHERPGEYRVVLVLLAVVTAYPNLAPLFLRRLHWWIRQPYESIGRGHSWDHFVQTIELPEAELEDLAKNRQLGALLAKPGTPRRKNEDSRWRELGDRLNKSVGPADERSFLPFEEAVLQKWARRIARYSFSFNLREVVDGEEL